MLNKLENKIPPLYEYNVEHWYGEHYLHTLNYVCWAEDNEHAVEQCIDHYNGDTVDITITRTYKISNKEYKE